MKNLTSHICHSVEVVYFYQSMPWKHIGLHPAHTYNYIERDHIVPLEPELVMSTPTYDPLGTETTYKSKLFLCQMGHTQNGHNQFWLYGDDILSDVSFANKSETDSNICFSNYCWSFWSHLFSALKWFVNKNIKKKYAQIWQSKCNNTCVLLHTCFFVWPNRK